MEYKNIYAFVAILVITAVAVWINITPDDILFKDTEFERDVHTRLGLDLRGGTQVLLKATHDDVTPEAMEVARGVIERRVNGLGVGETVVQLSGDNRVIVELPGVANPEQAIEILRGTGSLEFIDPQGQFLPDGTIVRTTDNPDPILTAVLTKTGELSPTNVFTPTIIEDRVFTSITSGIDLDTGQVSPTYSQDVTGINQPAVSFAFRGQSRDSLARFTAQNVGKPMCIVLDNRIISCPVIRSPLTDGSGIITTGSVEERDVMYNQLRYGALPVPLSVETSRTVSATLGQDSVEASIVAGIIGLSVVALFMILFYRLPGVIAVVALLMYTAICFAFYRLIPITLTLAGIAGFILSIGLAVDANVLIFARLKEELRRKRTMGPAIESGFNEAWPAIRDSSVSTLITSLVLFMFGNSFGVSIIKGFALTLGLGIMISLFSAIYITRTMLRLIAPSFAEQLWFFGIDRAEMEMAPPQPTGGRSATPTPPASS